MIGMSLYSAPRLPVTIARLPIATLLVCCWTWSCQGGSTNQDAGNGLLIDPGCDIAGVLCAQDTLCAERVCNGVGWTCARVLEGEFQGDFQWSREGTCDDGDPCTLEDVCLDGVCKGVPITCDPVQDLCWPNVCQNGTCRPQQIVCENRPHTTSGDCTAGKCPLTCELNYGDCDGDSDNGCESKLDTTEHCGHCDYVCPRYKNTISDCEQASPTSPFECTRTCEGNYENCDNDWDNGCEILVRVANTCNYQGIVQGAPGTNIPCGTAYCGSSSWPHINLGTYHCVFCDNCHYFPQENKHAWCNKETGNFYDYHDYGSCDSPGYEDRICSP